MEGGLTAPFLMTGPLAYPWEKPAPEAAGRPSAWGLLPESLAAMDAPIGGDHLFGRLQRTWTWKGGAPDLGKGASAWLGDHADLHLPEILERHASSDGSTKLVLGLADGQRIEAVHMPRRVR